jgi:hypothetical protein
MQLHECLRGDVQAADLVSVRDWPCARPPGQPLREPDPARLAQGDAEGDPGPRRSRRPIRRLSGLPGGYGRTGSRNALPCPRTYRPCTCCSCRTISPATRAPRWWAGCVSTASCRSTHRSAAAGPIWPNRSSAFSSAAPGKGTIQAVPSRSAHASSKPRGLGTKDPRLSLGTAAAGGADVFAPPMQIPSAAPPRIASVPYSAFGLTHRNSRIQVR